VLFHGGIRHNIILKSGNDRNNSELLEPSARPGNSKRNREGWQSIVAEERLELLAECENQKIYIPPQ